MPQPLEAVLTTAQKETLQLKRFIFHIIKSDKEGTDDESGVIFLDETPLTDKQQKFFIDRLKDTSLGTQFVFREETPHLKNNCTELVLSDEDFINKAKAITADFASRHNGKMSDGIFLVSEVEFLATANQRKQLIYLVKMDKSPAITYSWKETNGKKIAKVSEFDNSITENKKSIQKSAIVDITNHFVWDVLATDRTDKVKLTDFFKGFLGVTERSQDSVLTRLALSTTRKWLRTLNAETDFASGEDFNSCVGRAFNYLNDTDTFDTDNFINTVIRDLDNERKTRLTDSFRTELETCGIAGQQFTPKPDSLSKKDKEQKYQTHEGVTITFTGTVEAAGITISDLSNGKKRIVIETSGYITPL